MQLFAWKLVFLSGTKQLATMILERIIFTPFYLWQFYRKPMLQLEHRLIIVYHKRLLNIPPYRGD